jgi:hypothetical protein
MRTSINMEHMYLLNCETNFDFSWLSALSRRYLRNKSYVAMFRQYIKQFTLRQRTIQKPIIQRPSSTWLYHGLKPLEVFSSPQPQFLTEVCTLRPQPPLNFYQSQTSDDTIGFVELPNRMTTIRTKEPLVEERKLRGPVTINIDTLSNWTHRGPMTIMHNKPNTW